MVVVVVEVEVEVEVEEEGSSWISGMVSRDRRIVGLVWDFQFDLHQICQIKSNQNEFRGCPVCCDM